MTGLYDLVDEGWPVVRPFLLQDGDEDEIELVEQGSLGSQGLLGAGALEDEGDDKIANACTTVSALWSQHYLSAFHTLALLPRENPPSRGDDVVENLQRQVFATH